MEPVPRASEPRLIPSFRSELATLLSSPVATLCCLPTGVSCEFVRDGDVEVGVVGLIQSWEGLEEVPCDANAGTERGSERWRVREREGEKRGGGGREKRETD